MRILLDNCVDQRFGRLLSGHEAVHAREMGWSTLSNGELIAQADSNGFPAMITVDKNLPYQQNLSDKKISVIVLDSQRVTYKHIAPLAAQVLDCLRNLSNGAYVILSPKK